jgi:hypothetical protein
MAQQPLNGWTKWLVGALWAVVCGVILFMGNTVKANDDRNTVEHIDIRSNIVECNEKLREGVAKDIKEIQQAQTIILVQQAKMMTILEDIRRD